MSIISRLSDHVFLIVIAVLVIALSKPLFDGSLVGDELARYSISLAALLFSWAGLYIVTIGPFFKRPRLSFNQEIQRSDPTDNEKQQGWKRSWFIRLRVKNSGQLPAKNCIGRVIEIRKEDGTLLMRFDPLSLYWARQSEPDSFKPVDIQGNGDFFFLDIAQVKEKEKTLSLRVVIPKGQRLTAEADYSEQPDLPPGTYHMCIAVYGEGVYIRPTWFTVTLADDFEVDPPCSITVNKTSPVK
jgi:hypothetical protein